MLRGVVAGRRWWSSLGVPAKREILLFTVLLFCYGFFQQQPAWNEYSRYDLVRALVEQGTTRIDAYHENTGDAAYYQGHWYSDKAPGTALLGVPVYALQSLAGRLAGQQRPDDVGAVQALAFVESGIATAILVLLLIRFLAPFVGDAWALIVGLAYGFGSIAFPFATMFFGHAASTAALFAAFYLLHSLRQHPDGRRAIAAGFLAGVAVLIEIPVALGVAVLFVYALFRGRGAAARFVAGGLPLAVVLLAYDWLTFGSPFSIGYQYSPVFEGQNAQGLVSIVWPQLDTARDLLFGPRGLLRLAPWFALAPLGLVALRRRDVRFEVVLAAVICAAFLTYNSGALNPFGGWTPGPRYLLPALPFAAILVAFIPRVLRLVAAPLMLLSAAVFLVATATMPNAPERFTDPLFQLWLPRLASGALADSGAWLRWGLDGFAGLALLVMVAGLGIVVLGLSYARLGNAASAVIGRAIAVLAVLLVALSLPFPPLAPVALGWAGASAPPQVAVVLLGHTTLRIDGAQEVEFRAGFENRGGAIAASQLRFGVWRVTGEGVWAAYYGDIPIPSGTRDTTTMTWVPEGVPAGTYAYGFAVADGSGTDYANVRASDTLVISP